MHLWHVLLLVASAVVVVVTSSEVDGAAPEPPEGEAGQENGVPVGEPAQETRKRSGHYCNVDGYIFQHGQIFSHPQYSKCIKYQCNNGGWSVVQSGCERNGKCVTVGGVDQDGCRSLRCVQERRGNMHYYYMTPTVNDRCEVNDRGMRCVPKNQPITLGDCRKVMCVDTGHGGYQFQTSGNGGCADDQGNCVPAGGRYSKWVRGQFYRNCVCLGNGGYHCSG